MDQNIPILAVQEPVIPGVKYSLEMLGQHHVDLDKVAGGPERKTNLARESLLQTLEHPWI